MFLDSAMPITRNKATNARLARLCFILAFALALNMRKAKMATAASQTLILLRGDSNSVVFACGKQVVAADVRYDAHVM